MPLHHWLPNSPRDILGWPNSISFAHVQTLYYGFYLDQVCVPRIATDMQVIVTWFFSCWFPEDMSCSRSALILCLDDDEAYDISTRAQNDLPLQSFGLWAIKQVALELILIFRGVGEQYCGSSGSWSWSIHIQPRRLRHSTSRDARLAFVSAPIIIFKFT